jgi:hypothetical protein
MRKATDIVDFLLESVIGLQRRDLEARLKVLRAAELYPAARRVGERQAEPVSERHCVNLILALLGANEAIHSADAVPALYGLPLTTMPVAAVTRLLPNTSRPPKTFGKFLEMTLHMWRYGDRPWGDDVDITAIAVRHLPHRQAFVFFRLTAGRDIGAASLTFDDPLSKISENKLALHEMRSIHGYIIGAMVDFLGPIEAEAKRA